MYVININLSTPCRVTKAVFLPSHASIATTGWGALEGGKKKGEVLELGQIRQNSHTRSTQESNFSYGVQQITQEKA